MTFQEYYQHYLILHQNKWCRRLHVLGQLATILFIVFCLSVRAYWLLLVSPFIIYPFAWSGHVFFEKNKPASFTNPIWAKVCDWVMFKDILIGRIPW